MANRKELDPAGGPAAAYGARVRRLREERGWTQEELAVRTGYSSKHVSAVETGRRSSTLAFSRALDVAFGLAETEQSYESEWQKLRHGVLLEGFPEYIHQERRAVELRLFEIGIVPGLLQTSEYAQVLASSSVARGVITAGQAAERVEFLAGRQQLLEQQRPPALFVVMDESCIRRVVGGREVMAAQLEQLVEFAARPLTVLQVAPFDIGERRPFDLPVNLVTLPDRSVLAYAESQAKGHLERDNGTVASTLLDYHRLAAESLSPADSVAMIEEVRKGML